MKDLIPRDVSWLSFNARVLQEAKDETVPLREKVRFLGIHSNNQDEFFRVRVATLRRMIDLQYKKPNINIEAGADKILDTIQNIVLEQQSEFNKIWVDVQRLMNEDNVYLINEGQLNVEQQHFVRDYFDEDVSPNIIPLMIESLPQLPYLREKSIYLGVVMSKENDAEKKYALIEIPSRTLGRFKILPSPDNQKHIILLEDVIRYNLPYIFSYFGYKYFQSNIFKVTKDAEIDIDNDLSTTFIQKLQKGLKKRRTGKTVRFVYDKNMDTGLLEFLIKKLNLTKRDNIIPGGRIHNFRHFMDFPDVFTQKSQRPGPFDHPDLEEALRVTDVILKKDVLLHFPYHLFNGVIDLLREAAMDADVISIKLTAYRLASNSKVINALINAVRNGKEVVVMLEVKARFDEEANLEWKDRLEDEGVKVILGMPNLKVHAKACIIKRKKGKSIINYGFVSTGNMNEKTAKVYSDECLLTANRSIMADVNRIFKYLENTKRYGDQLRQCNTLIVSPVSMRKQLLQWMDVEIKNAKAKKKAAITVKMNSMSDHEIIEKIYEAAEAGVHIKLIIRGIFCAMIENKKFKHISAVSIVDEYLEHSRVLIFHNSGKKRVYIASADWMLRNLDHRIEIAIPIKDKLLRNELIDIIELQLKDNVKARILDNELCNEYVNKGTHTFRSQEKIREYLKAKAKPVIVYSD